MALLQNVIQRGTLSARPSAGSAGILYFASDQGQLYRDSGSAWQLVDATSLYSAKGQLLAASASGAVGALAAGTDGQQLMADSTQTLGIKWATVPAVRCYNSANQSVNNATWTALAYNSTRFDQGTATAQHSTSSNTSRLTCQQAGVYQITGVIIWDASATGVRAVRIRLNGTTDIARDDRMPVTTAGGYVTGQSCTSLFSLGVGDYVEFLGYQESGGALNATATADVAPEFMMARVG